MEVWDYIWLGITVVAAIVEAAVPALVSVWFVPGGLAALVASLFGAPLWLQVALFLVVSGAALILTRPLVKRIQSRKTISTNADMVLGKTALVTEEINNLLGAGRVTVLGNSWSARSADPESVIPSGEKVIVEKIEGVKLIVHQGYQS
ncbi:NfeD family protein [Neglectibacter timonensis]|uniref:NfeD family protein n=1 Tax=Neglectibacter timonensis TaxID=1776382 RepID=A0ABT1S3K9_9FIRM|nr:NfeD family protein [Neglectibacter timonensis]MCQ4841524.1 NfeD family protein [Neglectibacter timonensis]MCQ4845200.1 NfeD family protein [Neglectibacter timonensis]